MSVRVRYQVPTDGRLDLTSARTALYGWLYARHVQGRFFLSEAGGTLSPAIESFLGGLRLLGLSWDQAVDGCQDGITCVFSETRLSSERPSQEDALRYVSLPPVEGRDADVEIGEWVRRGYSGLALANCLARLGWSPRGKRALLTLDELAARFELGRVSRHPVAFDRRQLDWFNRRWLGALDADEATALLAPHWRARYGRSERAGGTALPPAAWQRTLAGAIRDELVLPSQAADKARFCFVETLCLDCASREALQQPYAAQILESFAHELPAVEPFCFDPLDAFCRELRLRFKSALGIRSRDVMHVLRAALTGRQDGPCLVVACQLLGKARCIQRAKQALLTASDR